MLEPGDSRGKEEKLCKEKGDEGGKRGLTTRLETTSGLI